METIDKAWRKVWEKEFKPRGFDYNSDFVKEARRTFYAGFAAAIKGSKLDVEQLTPEIMEKAFKDVHVLARRTKTI